MNERHGGAARTRAWHRINWCCTGSNHRRKCCGAISNAIANVMQPFAALVECFSNRRIGAGWGKQLDIAVSNFHEHFFDTVTLNHFTMIDGGAERTLVIVDGCRQIAHGNRNMVNFSKDHRRNLLNRASPTLARNSWSVTPSPSFSAKHNTPILPSCMLRCT